MLTKSLPANEDQHLAVSVKQGNIHTLGFLYDKYAPALMGIINRIINNKVQAEEILQITFVKIRDQIDLFDSSTSSLFTWLINIARQSAFDKSKSDNLKDQGFIDTLNKQNINNIEEDLSFPGSIQKLSFDLIYYKGLNCNEAAAELKIPVDELKKNIRIAIKNLNKIEAV